MSDHDEHHHDHDHDEPKAPVPLTPDDAGSKALSEALQSSFWIVKFIMAALVIVFFISGFFIVEPQQRAVVLRFGKPVGEGNAALLGPGAHWAWPSPIDEVVKVPFSQVQSANSTLGWYATTPEQEATDTVPAPMPTLDPSRDSYLLTGDANIIHVRAALRYRITDPLRFIFSFTTASAAVTNVLNEALYFAAAQFNVDDVLTRNQTAFRERIERRIDQVAAQQQLGITVEQVTLTKVIPPRLIADRFRAALEASVRSERVMNEAQKDANEALTRAQGEAASRIGIAESDRTRLVEAVKSEASRFWQAETAQRVFANAQERMYWADRGDGKSRTLRLDLSREPLKTKAAPEPVKEDKH